MLNQYYFAYNIPLGPSSTALAIQIEALLHEIGINPDIQVKHAGGFQVVRVVVPTELESAAAFRLIRFNSYLASQGPVG